MFLSIIPFQRPLHLKELVQKVTEAFEQRMDMFYLDREVSLLLSHASSWDSRAKQDRTGPPLWSTKGPCWYGVLHRSCDMFGPIRCCCL